MSDKDFAKLFEIADAAIAKAKTMTKKQAISSLNDAGIVTKKGKFKKAYAGLEEITQG
jgi:hypothetical protein